MATDIGDLVSQGTEFAKTLERAKQRVRPRGSNGTATTRSLTSPIWISC